MTHRQKVDLLITDLTRQGVGKSTVAPPLFRLLWALGLPVPPPLFLGHITLTLLPGACFGGLWVVITRLLGFVLGWLLWRQAPQVSWVWAVPEAAGAGLLFGLLMARYYRGVAAKLRLPSWESYAEAGSAADVDPSRMSSAYKESGTQGMKS